MAMTLTCTQCEHVNEGERIYCHNCGTKLDRSILPPSEKQSPAAGKAEHRRVKRAVNPSRGFFVGSGRLLFMTLLWSAIVASIIQMIRPPDGLPRVYSKDELMDAPPLPLLIEDLVQKPGAQRLALTTDSINRYLAYVIKSKPATLVAIEIKFLRSFVKCDKGLIRITTEQSIFDYPLYATTFQQLAIQNNRLAATNAGGTIGRMPIHPKIMEYGDLIFQRLWDAMTRERKLLDGLAAVEVQDGNVTLLTKSAR